jgi:hypothetical protein
LPRALKLRRPALRSIAFYFSVIAISLITMVKMAQAEGTVTPAASYTVTTPPVPPGGSGNFPSAQAACTGYLAWLVTYANATVPNYDWTMALGAVTESSCVYYSISASGAGNCRGTACDGLLAVSKPACPANSTGTTTCTCDTNFKPDPTGTSCIPDQYTISLSGLGGDVMPTKTRAAYAQVTTSTGSPKSGARVTLDLKVAPENGAPIRAEYVGSVSPNGGATGTDGRLPFVFTAPVAGGTHTITASCPSCANIYAQGTIRVPGCPIPPLTAPPFTDPVAEGFENGNRWRPDLLSTDPQNNYQTKLACVEGAIDATTKTTGSYTGTSAYRPFQYQQHLYEIVNRDFRLSRPGYSNSRYKVP